MKIAIGNDHTALEMKAATKRIWRRKAMKSWIWEPIPQTAVIIRYMVKK